MVGEVLSDISDAVEVPSPTSPDAGWDYKLKLHEQTFYFEVKRHSKLLGVGTVSQFFENINREGCKGVIVVATGVSKRAMAAVTEHNKMMPQKMLYVVIGDNRDLIIKGISQCHKNGYNPKPASLKLVALSSLMYRG